MSERISRSDDWADEGLRDDLGPPTNVRYGVLGMLCLLTFILYLDRICIGQAARAIQSDLGLSSKQMGFVFSAFTIAYGLFEVPTGRWSDRFGSRGVLTRIVLWWSAFTALTGASWGFASMLAFRFLFGAGEAGALPNAARVVARWFPAGALGWAQGSVIATMLVGGAVAPLATQRLIAWIGWRGTFAALALPGIAWAVAFYWRFRDDPAQHPAVNASELRLIDRARPPSGGAEDEHVPWRYVLTSRNLWLMGGVISCAASTTYMIFSWYPSYLHKGRDIPEEEAAKWASLVLAGGAVGSTLGGWFSDWLVRRMGDRRAARCMIGTISMSSAGLALGGSVLFDSEAVAAALCTWACFAIHVQVATWWGVVAEISGRHLGSLFGLMNSMGVPAAAASPILLGWWIDWSKKSGLAGREQWDPPFYVYGGLLILGGLLWLFIDATKSLVSPENASQQL